jgi:hypothetical protein
VELLTLLRSLWRHWILVLLGVFAAAAVGLTVANTGTSRSGTANVRVLLDTARSQLVDAEVIGADTLGWRASLLADLMSSRSVRTDIARDLNIPEDSLVVVAQELTVPAKPTPLSELGLDAAAVTPEPYVLTLSRTAGADFDSPLPIISLNARAPDRQKATRLVNVATSILEASASGPEDVRGIQQLVVESVGPVRAQEDLEEPGPLVALLVAIVVFGVWCCCVVLASGVARARRLPRRVQPAG